MGTLVGVAGGAGGIWHLTTRSVVGSSVILHQIDQEQIPTSFKASSQVPVAVSCAIVDTHEKNVFEILNIEDENSYTAMTCKGDNSDESETSVSDKWTGLFPYQLFRDDFRLYKQLGENFDLEMITESISRTNGSYKTTFTSSQSLNSPVTGEWFNKVQKELDRSITTVKITSPENKSFGNIYLLFGQEL